ncbi:hypothetical protein PF005_g2508 [Phytophthora fragariae]|uniref:Uncharacterized protein n=1 Tax=Phytophthora fragariae TaxID=53985 RepID=A0A6A3TKF7_9STRA|nr:hypothetical protein PF003_g29793 [Phytophthora fragariae]KAE8947692.1 hypothetical protein PF009_g2695 [Phytophthora fragariae]KAE9027617.1 hypothetical protein PF011_g1971 [Phytophthora fragariae]KAE9135539.1 hypothetical protein PF010_g2064 [Phytophthora fragariae]KAE9135648.1 hypothetical protein PF007_g2495 [Phytophthora fragariae]
MHSPSSAAALAQQLQQVVLLVLVGEGTALLAVSTTCWSCWAGRTKICWSACR